MIAKKMIKLIKDKNFQFGIIFSIIFLFLSIFLDKYKLTSYVFIILFVILINISIFKPLILEKPTSLWIQLGFFLAKIISPIFLFIVFFLIVTPIGVLLKIFKKDILLLKINITQKTYWINKNNITSDMKDQF
jgi:hypothetical protein